MRVVIVGGGTVSDEVLTSVIRSEGEKATHVIAADAGLAPLLRNHITPDFVVGDFDSLADRSKLDEVMKSGVRIRTLNPIKDDTDMESALHAAYELAPDEIILLGATGTRIDHMLGNIQLLKQADAKGCRATIVDAHNRIRFWNAACGPLELTKAGQYGKYVSVLPFGDSVTLSMSGFFYPLDHSLLTSGNTLGVSNELTEDGTITIHEGAAVIIESRD